MRKSAILAVPLALVWCGSANAVNLALIASPPALMDLAVLIIAAVCTIGCLKILTLVRGGLLSRGWQFFAASFGLLALVQLLAVLERLEVFVLPEFLLPACLALMSIIFLGGILQTKRTLG